MTDNGNGFNTENYTSFLEAYSQLKVKKGCKGIGRFLLLKAFDSQVRQALISGTLAPGGRNDGSQPPDRRLPEAGMEGSAFAEIACPAGYQGHTVDLPEHGGRQGEKDCSNPWTAVPELRTVFAYMKSRWSEIGVRANGIGAHVSMLALDDEALCKALLASPVVDMERLIADMMRWAGVTEQEFSLKVRSPLTSGNPLLGLPDLGAAAPHPKLELSHGRFICRAGQYDEPSNRGALCDRPRRRADRHGKRRAIDPHAGAAGGAASVGTGEHPKKTHTEKEMPSDPLALPETKQK